MSSTPADRKPQPHSRRSGQGLAAVAGGLGGWGLPVCLLLAAAPAVRAQTLTLNRSQVALPPGGECQFEVVQGLEPDVHPSACVWTLEDEQGRLAPPEAGSISQYGTYHAPAVLPAGSRRVLVKVTAGGDPRHFGSALVTLLPAAARGAGEPARRAPGVAFLAGGGAGDGHADSPVGAQARFAAPRDLAFAARIPRTGRPDLRDVVLVAEKGGVSLVFPDGGVRQLPAPKPVRGPVEVFERLALRPGTGSPEDPWELFLYGQNGPDIYRMDGDGQFTVLRTPSGESLAAALGGRTDPKRRPGGMAADRHGNLYVAVVDQGEHPNRILRITPDGVATTLAGGGTVPGHLKDGRGGSAGFGRVKGLALDEGEGVLYALDGKVIRAVKLEDGTVTTLPKDCLPQDAELEGLAWHRERLLVGGHQPPALFVVDPATGKGAQAYEDGDARRSKAQAASPGLRPGPCLGADADHQQRVSGSLGERFAEFAFGPGDQLVFRSGGQLGVLRLDWEALAPGSGGARVTREEKPALAEADAAPSPGDSKRAPAPAIESRRSPAGSGLERKDGPGPAAGIGLAEAGALPQIGRLRPRAGMQIPNPPFSLRGLDDSWKMTPEMAARWQDWLGRKMAPQVRDEWRKHLLHPGQAGLPEHRRGPHQFRDLWFRHRERGRQAGLVLRNPGAQPGQEPEAALL